jgi:hypothetical protein
MTATGTSEIRVHGGEALGDFHQELAVLRDTSGRGARAAQVRRVATACDHIARSMTGRGTAGTDPLSWHEAVTVLMCMAAALEGFRLEGGSPENRDTQAAACCWADLSEAYTSLEWATAWQVYRGTVTAEFDTADEMAGEPVSARRRFALSRACEVSETILAGWPAGGIPART